MSLSGQINLHLIVTNNERKTLPIAQQLPEKQDMLYIYYKLGNRVPSGMKSVTA